MADCYDSDRGGTGLARTAADTDTEVSYLLGAPFENGPDRRPSSYLATVLIDLAAIIPGSAELYMDLINELLAVNADPS